MKGIIIKPKSCCGDASQIGTITQYVGKAPKNLFGCTSCMKPVSRISLVEVNTPRGLDLVEFRRIKWFDDDLGTFETEEVNQKEEDVTI